MSISCLLLSLCSSTAEKNLGSKMVSVYFFSLELFLHFIQLSEIMFDFIFFRINQLIFCNRWFFIDGSGGGRYLESGFALLLIFIVQRLMKRVFHRDWRNIINHFLLTERSCLLDYIKLVKSQSVASFLFFYLKKFHLIIIVVKRYLFQRIGFFLLFIEAFSLYSLFVMDSYGVAGLSLLKTVLP